jgi:hypothetical protein
MRTRISLPCKGICRGSQATLRDGTDAPRQNTGGSPHSNLILDPPSRGKAAPSKARLANERHQAAVRTATPATSSDDPKRNHEAHKIELWKIAMREGSSAVVATTAATPTPQGLSAQANNRLRSARRSRRSPSGSGRVLSRQEVADGCNQILEAMYAQRVQV